MSHGESCKVNCFLLSDYYFMDMLTECILPNSNAILKMRNNHSIVDFLPVMFVSVFCFDLGIKCTEYFFLLCIN